MSIYSSAAAIAAPIIGAAVLVLGTGTAVGISARDRREERRAKPRAAKNSTSNPSKQGQTHDEEEGAGWFENEDKAEASRTVVNEDGEVNAASASANKNNAASVPDRESGLDTAGESGDFPLRLPTVSAATCIFGSPTYVIFVCTAIIHGPCFVITSLLQCDAAKSSPTDTAYATTLGILLLVSASIGCPSIILTSLIPAKGRGTGPHIVFGAIFFECALLWMVWTCMLTPVLGLGPALLAVRVVLVSTANLAMFFVARIMCSLRQIQGKEEQEEEWYWLIHLASIGQLTFGLAYAIFLGTVSYDLLNT